MISNKKNKASREKKPRLSPDFELKQLKAMYQISLELVEKSLNKEEILKLVGRLVRKAMGFDRFRLYFYSENSNLLWVVQEEGMDYPSQYLEPAKPQGVMAELIRLYKLKQNKFLYIENVADFQKYPFLDRKSIAEDLKRFGTGQVKEAFFMVFGYEPGRVNAVIAINNWATGRPLFLQGKEAQIKILETFINQASLAYQRAELHENLEKKMNQLASLYQMTSLIAGRLKPQVIIEVLTEGLTRSLDFKHLLIFSVGEENQAVKLTYASDPGFWEKFEKQATRPKEKSILTDFLKYQRPVELEPEKIEMVFGELAARQKIKSCLVIPGIAGGKIRLLVVLADGELLAYLDEKTQNFLEILANSSAIALENSEIYQTLQNRANHLEALYNIGVAITSTLDIEEILKRIVREVREGLGFDRAGLFLVDWPAGEIRGKVGTDAAGNIEKIDYQIFPLEEKSSHMAEIALGREEYYLAEDISKTAPPSQKKFLVAGVSQNLVVPLKSKGKVMGLIAVDNFLTKKEISQDDLQFLQSFAAQASIALENAALFKELEESKKDTEDIIESDPVPTIVLNDANQIVFVNESYERTYNIKRAEILSKNYFNLFPYSQKEGREEIVNDVKVSGREYSEDNVEHLTHDNRLIYQNIRISRRARGGVIITVEDVTKRVKLRRALREQAIQLEKISMIAKITRTMAHEINNPLTSVVCYTQVLSRQLKDDLTDFGRAMKDLKALTQKKLEIEDETLVKKTYDKFRNLEKVYKNAIDGLSRAYEQSSRIAEVIRKLTKMGDEAKIVIEQDYPGGVKILDIEKTLETLDNGESKKKSNNGF